jgi:diacylglycerol kinase family enzyme
MRICLYWNPTAGDEAPLESLTAQIRDAGHEIARVLGRTDDPSSATASAVDVLVAAGGDGTVARAARALAGTALPIAILPMGTANNIANSLGINDDPGEAIAAWDRQRVTRMDLGAVSDERGERLFVEGVGIGLLPKGITRGRDEPEKDRGRDAAAEMTWARRVFLDALSRLQPQRSRIVIDGEEIAGDYLLVEVLNIASVGPRLRLSDETAPADGMLSLVIAGDDDRDAIAAHLRRPWKDDDSHAWLKSWRGTRIEVSGWHEYHVDDEVCTSVSGKLTIGIRPSTLAVLA